MRPFPSFNRLIQKAIVPMSICTIFLFSCTPVQPLEQSVTMQSAPFLHDGITTVQEVEGRLGSQFDSYEDGRIKIYKVSFDSRDRLTLAKGSPCHALVLVFDATGLLQRHSLIKHGCGREPQ